MLLDTNKRLRWMCRLVPCAVGLGLAFGLLSGWMGGVVARAQATRSLEVVPVRDGTGASLIMGSPTLQVGKVYSTTAVAGTFVTYTLTVTNTGDEAATNVVLRDILPAGLTYGGGDGQLINDTVTWTLPHIGAGAEGHAWFWGILPCGEGWQMINAAYWVASSDQGVGSAVGPMLNFPVIAPSIQAGFESSAATAPLATTLFFTDTSTTNGASLSSWDWDFGDGSEHAASARASHAYRHAGTYTVTLTAQDACGDQASTSTRVTLVSPAFEVTKAFESSGVAGTLVTYTLTVANIGSADGTDVVLSDVLPQELTYLGGDGQFADGMITWTLASIAMGGRATGVFSATLPCTAGLHVVNSDYAVRSSVEGAVSPLGPELHLVVSAPHLIAAFLASTTTLLPGGTLLVTDQSVTNGTPIVAWDWDWGDGDVHGTGASTSHIYTSPGTYSVTLTVADGCDYRATASFRVTVRAYNLFLSVVRR